MATVPSSGTLSMKSMAQEALHGTYGSGTITGSIGLYALVNGGNQNSGNTYPAVNQACLPNPANRGYNALTDVKDNMGTDPGTTYYYNSNIGNASNLTVGDYLYTNTALTTPATGLGCALQYGSSATTTICSNPANYAGCIDTDSSGAINVLNTSAC